MVTTRSSGRNETTNRVKRDVGGELDDIRRNDAKDKKYKKDGMEELKDTKKGKQRSEVETDDIKRENSYISPDGAGAFNILPPELIDLILCECGTSSLLNINRTSKFFHAYCHPKIYKTVDLCIHNETTPFKSEYERRPPWRHAKWTVNDEAMLNKQRLFMRTINERPLHAGLVKRLVWTFKTFVAKKKKYENKHIVRADDVWATFAKLHNVTSLDFGCLFSDWPLHTPPSQLLFPFATSVRLVGQVALSMAQHLLHVKNLGQINDLELDYTTFYGAPRLDRAKLEEQIAMKPQNFKRKVRLLHPLAAYLLDVKSQFTSLANLSIRSLDSATKAERELTSVSSMWYAALSEFINAVRPTLESLLIEQAYVIETHAFDPLDIFREESKRYTENEEKRFSRLLLSSFQKNILPVLQKGSWQQLRYLKVVGEPWNFDHLIGRDDWYNFDLIPIIDTLEKDLSDHVRISVDRQASRTFGSFACPGFGNFTYGFREM